MKRDGFNSIINAWLASFLFVWLINSKTLKKAGKLQQKSYQYWYGRQPPDFVISVIKITGAYVIPRGTQMDMDNTGTAYCLPRALPGE
eukprot:scaffold91848_cov39-Prasinocladus_malaysianus.AAC.2